MSRILVVDDDDELRLNVAEILAGAGFGVEVAATAEQGLTQLAAVPCDLVLLDLVMPGMGGREALPLFRRQAPASPVVVMTAFATVDSAVDAMRTGAADYLVKPFRLDQLLAVVRRCLEEARLRRCAQNAHSSGAPEPDLPSLDQTFQGLANPYRRRIIGLLGTGGPRRFMDIVRCLEVDDHTKVNFHLRVLREAGLIEPTDSRDYRLTAAGRRVLDCIARLAVGPTPGM